MSVIGVARGCGGFLERRRLTLKDDLAELLPRSDRRPASSGSARRQSGHAASTATSARAAEDLCIAPIVASLQRLHVALARRARCPGAHQQSSLRRSIISSKIRNRACWRISRTSSTASYACRSSAAARSSCSRRAFRRSRIAASSYGALGLRHRRAFEGPAGSGCAPCWLRRRISCSVLEARDELAVLRLGERQRILRLNRGVGIEHPRYLRGRQRPAGRFAPSVGGAGSGRCAADGAPAPPAPSRTRERPCNERQPSRLQVAHASQTPFRFISDSSSSPVRHVRPPSAP